MASLADCQVCPRRASGEDKVCLGTDYPFPLGEFSAESRGQDYVPGRLIDGMEWTDERRRAVLVRAVCCDRPRVFLDVGRGVLSGPVDLQDSLCRLCSFQGGNALEWLGLTEDKFLR